MAIPRKRLLKVGMTHGYNDVLEDPAEFESQLIKNPKAYVKEENYFTVEVSESATEQTSYSSERVLNRRIGFCFDKWSQSVQSVSECVVRHGYNDVLEDPAEFESQLIKNLKAYVKEENNFTCGGYSSERVLNRRIGFCFDKWSQECTKCFECVVRHGYNDVLEDPAEFESQLIINPKAYVQEENYFTMEVSGSATEQIVVVESSDKRETHNSSNTIITNQSASTSSNSI
ncbi:hypothetical protein ACSQ67_020436 [Phaseolus vulgaris]